MKKSASASKSKKTGSVAKKSGGAKKQTKPTKKKAKKVAIGSMNGLNWDKRKKRG